MSNQAKVEDFEVFRQLRAALVKFAQAADLALSGADSEIRGTQMWLETEQSAFWQEQRRKRTEAMVRARDAVRQKKLYKDATGRIPGAVEEEKILAKCVAALEESERKIDAIRKSLPKLEKANDHYRGGVARLNGVISADVPRALALLDRLGGMLEEYVRIEAPAGSAGEVGMTTETQPSISRGGDSGAAEPPAAVARDPAKTEPRNDPAQPAQKKEGRDVADG